MIAKSQCLMRCSWTTYSRENPRGSGYCEDQGVDIERWTEWRLLGVLIWRRREVVRALMPHEWISGVTLGSWQ
jgi:hypothetical protein